MSPEIRVSADALRDFTKSVFVKVGAPAEDAEKVASVLVWANLRGVDSHGVQLVPWYVEAADIGHIKVKPNIRIEKETPATLLIDADHAFGAVVTVFAMQKVMAKAKKVGIGWALIRKHNHQGTMGYYPLLAAEKGMAGITFLGGNTTTAPFGAKFPGIANNPIAIAVPGKKHRPLVLDMALSQAAGAKLILAKEKGLPIPQGWAFDKDGNSTTDPSKAAFLTPLGGPKGSGLSIMIECLTGVLVDFPKVEPVVTYKEPPYGLGSPAGNPERMRRHIQNSTVAAIDISQFTDVESYKEHIDSLIDGIKGLPKAEGFTEIFVPGEPEWRTMDQRMKSGIPIPEKTFANLSKVGERFGLKLTTE